jgi:hypothetical protein
MESLYEKYENTGDGLVVVQLLGQNYNGGNNVTVANLQKWISDIDSAYGTTLTYVVAADPGFSIGNHFNKTGYIPYFWLIDQNKVIYFKSLNFGMFESRIKILLGVD